MIEPGKTIAIKVPQHNWDEMVAIYRGRVGLEPALEVEATSRSRLCA